METGTVHLFFLGDRTFYWHPGAPSASNRV
jgi:hypothetical protein